ncbi:hypothetical protein [Sediminibacillus albus]|uniref:Uncharacterized protein n=1 Tax=Sediminibacillus albus TaxID=407036 RepID=A0A1G9C7I3_9BACI|nr:hypothetical protein [Sediminibacillus albus]SDK47622.1 hypothetical protein SAMN05216243_3294 [Sediminibacillus albus]
MSPEIERVIYSYILLPYVLKVFKIDRLNFEELSSPSKFVYLEKLDTVINSVQQDYNAIRKKVFSGYHVNVKYVGKENDMVQYKWYTKNDSGVIWIAVADLRDMTKELMNDYLYGPLAVEVTPSNKPWC